MQTDELNISRKRYFKLRTSLSVFLILNMLVHEESWYISRSRREIPERYIL